MKLLFTLSLCSALGLGFGANAQFTPPDSRSPGREKAPERTELLIPNAFSPNNDGHNDVFKIINFGPQTLLEFKVFNRWGTVLFKTTDPETGWDGMYQNKKQPLGVYGYLIRIGYPEGVVETYKGTVTLVR